MSNIVSYIKRVIKLDIGTTPPFLYSNSFIKDVKKIMII